MEASLRAEVTDGDMTQPAQPADAQAEAEDLLAADALMAHAQSSPGVSAWVHGASLYSS